MNIKEFYSAIGGDYDAVMAILMKEERIKKYLVKFADSDEFEELKRTLDEKDYKEAFRHSHSLKGMCLNLGLGTLAVTSNELCEMLRKDEIVDDIESQFELVKADYAMVKEAIAQVD